MRAIRGLALLLTPVVLWPSMASAQAGRLFSDSWFWGAKAGAMVFSTAAESHDIAPYIGVDWLITRTKGGLYVSVDRAFFNKLSSVDDEFAVGGSKAVGIKDMTRLGVAAVGFPSPIGRIRPYVGLGWGISLIGTATPLGTYQNQAEQTTIENRVEDQRSQGSFVAMGGAQMEMKRFSVFAQGTANPYTQMLAQGTAWNVEAGIRYNVGTSIEQITRPR